MDIDREWLDSLQLLDSKSRRRPCNLAEVNQWQSELENILAEFRMQRELFRANAPINAESYSIRTATHAIRSGILNTQAAHSRAELQIRQLASMVYRGHASIAELVLLNNTIRKEFSDLGFNSVYPAIPESQINAKRIFIAGYFSTAVLLAIIGFLEMLFRSLHQTP